MDKNINQPSPQELFEALKKTETLLVKAGILVKDYPNAQALYDQWVEVQKVISKYESAERPAEAPASSGHTYDFDKNVIENAKLYAYVFENGTESFNQDRYDAFLAGAKCKVVAFESMREVLSDVSKELQEARAEILDLRDARRNRDRDVEISATANSVAAAEIEEKLGKELQEAKEEIAALRRDDSLPMRTVISERDNARKELQEARAALEKIKNLSKYKSDHDQILYDFKEIHEIATAVLSSPPDTQKL